MIVRRRRRRVTKQPALKQVLTIRSPRDSLLWWRKRKSPPAANVTVHAETLSIDFIFRSKSDADLFFEAQLDRKVFMTDDEIQAIRVSVRVVRRWYDLAA